MEKYLSIVTPDDVETQILEWGTFQWLNAPNVTGANHMTVGIGRISPGFGHTRHNHVGTEEFIYFMEGEAEQTVERADGEVVKKTVHAGDLVFIGDSMYHSTINTGDKDLVFMACYLNPGSEKDLRAAAVQIIPPKNTN